MTCREAITRIHEALDERAARWAHPLAMHLRECTECRTQAGQLAAVADLMAGHEVPQPSNRYFATAAKRAVLARRRPPAPRFRHFRLVAMAAGVAAMCMVSFSVGRALSPKREAPAAAGIAEGPSVIPSLPSAEAELASVAGGPDLPFPIGSPEPIPVVASESLPVLPAMAEVAEVGGGSLPSPPARGFPRTPPSRPSAGTPRTSGAEAARRGADAVVVIERPGHRIVIHRIEGGTEIGPLAPSALPWVEPERPSAATEMVPAEYRM